MAKGKDVAPMEIDEQNSTDSDQINNPKFSVNGTLSVYVFFFFFPGYPMFFSTFCCGIFSFAAFEIGSNAAWIALW